MSVSIPSLRDDIQALRGWAVLLVLIDHFGLGPFPQGHLGVDIFFVISGFLITAHIAEGVRASRFSFAEFYSRRARRLLPAAYATTLLTVLAAPWFLSSIEMEDFTAQVIGAMTFSINFVLLAQTDYFAVSAHLKPLLHMWSLAVEEQFYIVLPLLLVVVPARWWPLGIVGLGAASAGACWYLLTANPSAAFYMLPARAWELLIGSAGALLFTGQWPRLLLWPALLLLVAVPAYDSRFAHPGLDALVVCVATLAVIQVRSEAFGRVAQAVRLVWVGDISYSLYLVHWPIMAFLYSAHVGADVALSYRIFGLIMSFALAVAMYRYVEQPFRRGRRVDLRGVAVAALAACGIAAGQVGIAARADGDLADIRRPNRGLDDSCDGASWLSNANCRTGDAPEIVVWGDSFAMHLVPGLQAVTQKAIGQATTSACGPLEGLAWHRPKHPDPARWARSCIDFNRRVLEEIIRTETISTVVLSSPFRDFSDGSLWVKDREGISERTASFSLALSHLRSTVGRLEAAGKKVVIVGPPPAASGLDLSLCVQRKRTGQIILGPARGCTIPTGQVRGDDAEVFELLRRATEGTGTRVVLLHDVMCDESACYGERYGAPLYRDTVHLSHLGSVEVMKRTGIGAVLDE